MYRHGDLIIIPTGAIPVQSRELPHLVLAHGEVTGHTHRIADKQTAKLYTLGGQFYLDVTAPHARLIHEEHHTIELPKGLYLVRHQREYTPERIRRVID